MGDMVNRQQLVDVELALLSLLGPLAYAEASAQQKGQPGIWLVDRERGTRRLGDQVEPLEPDDAGTFTLDIGAARVAEPDL